MIFNDKVRSDSIHEIIKSRKKVYLSPFNTKLRPFDTFKFSLVSVAFWSKVVKTQSQIYQSPGVTGSTFIK